MVYKVVSEIQSSYLNPIISDYISLQMTPGFLSSSQPDFWIFLNLNFKKFIYYFLSVNVWFILLCSYNFYTFFSFVLELLLTLHSGITPGSTQKTIWDMRDRHTWVGYSALPLFYHASPQCLVPTLLYLGPIKLSLK